MQPSRYSLLSVIEAGDQLAKSRWFVYRLIRKGLLSYHKMGGTVCVAQRDLDAYVEKTRRSALGERKTRKLKETVTP